MSKLRESIEKMSEGREENLDTLYSANLEFNTLLDKLKTLGVTHDRCKQILEYLNSLTYWSNRLSNSINKNDQVEIDNCLKYLNGDDSLLNPPLSSYLEVLK